MQNSTRLKQLKNVEAGGSSNRFGDELVGGGGSGSEATGQYDLNPSGSKALKAASEHRAKIVTFYINGEPFKPCIRVSIVPGKDFHSLTSLYDYLNGKSQVTFGVRYIFTVAGKRITSIDDLESGCSYVISDNTRFQVLPYGKQEANNKGANNINGIILSNESVKSVSSTLPLSTFTTVLDRSPRSQSLNSKESKIVTIVNRKDPTLRTRVFLNLRSQRTFELIIKDLGQAVMVKDARKLYTSDGEEIRSISQLRRQLSDFTIFYIESAKNRDKFNRNNNDKNKNPFNHLQRSNSLESINLHGFKDEEPENSINTHRSQDISTVDYIDQHHPETPPPSVFQFNSTESVDKLWTQKTSVNGGDQLRSVDWPLEGQLKKTEVTSIATQTSPRTRQPRNQVKRKEATKTNQSNRQSSDKLSTINNQSKPLQSSEKQLLVKSNNQKLTTRAKRNQSNPPIEKRITKQLTKSSNRSSANQTAESTDPVILVPIEVDDKEPKVDNLQQSTNASRPETKSFNSKSKLGAIKSNDDKDKEQEKKSEKSIDYNNSDDEERIKLFSELIKDKVKTKVENRRKEKNFQKSPSSTTNRSLSRARVSSAFREGAQKEKSKVDINKGQRAGSSLTSIEDIINGNDDGDTDDTDRLSVLEKIAHDDNYIESLTTIKTPNRQNINSDDNLFKGINVPDKNFQLSWVYGYKGNQNTNCNNLVILENEEIVFFVASIVVLWHPNNQTQRHYKEHTHDIQCMALDHQSKFIATAHENTLDNDSLFSGSEIRVWNSSNLITSAVYENLAPSTSIISVSFTNLGFLLILCCKDNISLIIWDWKNNQEIASINAKLTKDVKLIGAKSFPQGGDVITFGLKHLTFWQSIGSKYNPTSLIKPKSKEPSLFTCIDFLSNGDFLTGSADGFFTLWSQNPDNGMVFRVTDLKGHETSIECIKYLSNNILVSSDINGLLMTWDISDLAFRQVNTIMVPKDAGGITSLCSPNNTKSNPNFNVYIGTQGNFIAHGSAINGKKFEILCEGHSGGLRGIAALPGYTSFFTCGLDSRVCRWGDKRLDWKSNLDVQLLSIAVHPSCQALAVGGVNGVIQILEADSGSLAAQLNVCKVPVVCLAYSPNGNFLAAGAHDGVMYLLPVFDDGFVYEKVSVLKGPHPILSLQWSTDNCFLLTSVNDNNYQELIIWDLPNFRYLTGISSSSENLKWHEATCSGGEDVRGIWDNHNIEDVINVCCHCSPDGKYLVTGDEEGHIRLFSYPCSDPTVAFYMRKQGSTGVVEARFLSDNSSLVTANFDGALFLWNLYNISG